MIPYFTVTGRQLDLGNPRPADVCLEDVACGLSKICRYNGQIDLFYSVAQHACLVAELVRSELAYPALNHDDSEAYTGDVSSKLKHSPLMAGYREIEHAWSYTCERAFGITSLTPEERHEIKVADDLAAVFERLTLRYRQEFSTKALERAIADQWVTHSSMSDMLAIAHRLPKFMTPVDHSMARTQFVVAFARYGVRWREHTR